MSIVAFRARAPRDVVTLVVLALAGLTGCGDDPSGPGTAGVFTIVISGVPTASLRVDGTTQLVATTLSETGSVISGAPVSWKSSNHAVATVSSGGLVIARGAGQATVTATSGAASAVNDIFVVAPLTLDLSGSTVSLPDGSLTITVHPGHWSGSATFLVGPVANESADDKIVPGTTFRITDESGLGGSISGASLSLRYDPARLPAGVSAGGLQLYKQDRSTWIPVRGSSSDPASRLVTGTFENPGTYAVRFTPVSRVIISGALVDGALYVGQTAQLGAAAVTALGDTLINQVVTWSSSPAGALTVDADGTVTAIGPGTAIITATTDGLSATTQMQVLARPVASWPDESDWTTFRGNNRRTGFVDATLDPITFSTRWETTVSVSAILNEPATGDGHVYLSTHAYFGGTQGLWALDAATGAERWTRAFGDIHSVNAPATNNGRVYVTTGGHADSYLWSFGASDGTVRFRSAFENQWSRWPAPAVTSGIAFLGTGYFGGMSAFDALDGTLLWQRDLPQIDGWTPAADAGMAYAFGSDGFLALDDSTGAETISFADVGIPAAGTPVIAGNNVYVIGFGRLLALDLSGRAVAWERPGAYEGVPAVDDTHVYSVVSNQVEARDRTDGSLTWTWVPQAGMRAAGSVIVTRNLLFVRVMPTSYDPGRGRVVALDLTAQKVVWSYDAAGEIALGDGLLLITSGSTGTVTAIDVE